MCLYSNDVIVLTSAKYSTNGVLLWTCVPTVVVDDWERLWQPHDGKPVWLKVIASFSHLYIFLSLALSLHTCFPIFFHWPHHPLSDRLWLNRLCVCVFNAAWETTVFWLTWKAQTLPATFLFPRRVSAKKPLGSTVQCCWYDSRRSRRRQRRYYQLVLTNFVLSQDVERTRHHYLPAAKEEGTVAHPGKHLRQLCVLSPKRCSWCLLQLTSAQSFKVNCMKNNNLILISVRLESSEATAADAAVIRNKWMPVNYRHSYFIQSFAVVLASDLCS